MKFYNRHIRNVLFLLAPFIMMILVNESVRLTIKDKPYSIGEVTCINSADKILDRCTWICHNNTTYCLKNHVKSGMRTISFTKSIYFGIISMLKSSGNYMKANLVVFVLIIPITIWFFLIKVLDNYHIIRKLKQK